MLTPQQILSLPAEAECPGVRTTRGIVIRDIDGWEQFVQIFEPETASPEPHPTILLVHGGGFHAGHPQGVSFLARFLALAYGMTTVSPSYRLGTPLAPTYPKPLEDIAYAWDWTIANAGDWHIDPAKMFVGGSSAGGCLSTLALTKGLLPDCRGLVDLWGPLDFVARWFDNGEKPGGEVNLLPANYPDDPTAYHEASALTHVKLGLPPALFIYGGQDPTVHKRQGQLGLGAWLSVGSSAEYFEFDNIGHGVVGDNTASMIQVMLRTGEFLTPLM